ncbi:hypothetical protein SNEBB_006964 [Seison nebaliae]|nr:hypothetical protein SNEBB_006964 [Seison nebaliae]
MGNIVSYVYNLMFGFEVQTHIKALTSPYARTDVRRVPLKDVEVPWSYVWPEYSPPEYTAEFLKGQNRRVYADPDFPNESTNTKVIWNELDENYGYNRKSFMGHYEFDEITGMPLNPIGRTGLCGRGILGRWGPNHAADAIVTRWCRNEKNEIVKSEIDGKRLLEFVSIRRGDTGEYALPGGMVDKDELVSEAIKREFGEEALNSLEMEEEEKMRIMKNLEEFFTSKGYHIYSGYVDDPRNTDNAWMETVATSFHDESGECMTKFQLNAGDDASHVQWTKFYGDLQLYASHASFIQKAAEYLNASFSN